MAVPLKYLCNFWISFEMPLINCKVELKLGWAKHCVIKMIMLMLIVILLVLLPKTKNSMFLSSLYQQKKIKNYQNLLAKDLKV